jgi:hypothetical protein
MQSVPINVLKKSTFTCMHKALHTAARARGSQLKLGAGQLQRKKKREGFFSIYKTKAALLCLSHAFIQLQSVRGSLELHTPESQLLCT